MINAGYREFDAITRLHMSVFLQRVFAELNPGVEFMDNFHIHVIIDALEEMRHGRSSRLAVALPPRSLKSIIISVAWVAWLLGHDPTMRIICVSYGQELADKLANDCRQVIQTGWYQALFPQMRLRPGRQSLANFETTAGGGRFSTSVGGTLTGFGANTIILDDAMKPAEALSDAERANANGWIENTLFSRLDDKRRGRILVVMQRLHEEDVIGNLQARAPGTFRLLSFPAIAQADEVHEYETAFGRRVWRRAEGEALHPEREPLHILHQMRSLLGTANFSAQYLQSPVPLEGNLIKRDWLRRYGLHELSGFDRVIQSWDTASKPGQMNDWSVGTTWGVKGERIFLLHVVREKLDFPALKQRIIEEAERQKAELVLVEDKGSGTSLLQELPTTGFWRGRAFKPEGDKISRFAGVSPMFEEGRVLLPPNAAWLDDYVHELCGFPGVRHDDQVDSTSQALAWLRNEGNPGGLWHYMRQEHERKVAYREHRTVRMRAPAGISHYITRHGDIININGDRVIWLTEEEARSAEASGYRRHQG